MNGVASELVSTEPTEDLDQPRELLRSHDRSDRIFRRVTTGAAASSLIVMGLIAVFLFIQARPALTKAGWSFFTRFEWTPDGEPAIYGIASSVYGTVVMSILALAIAVPVSISTALFINEFSPRRVRRGLITLIDLLAAVPSIIFGLWGRDYLMPKLNGLASFLSRHFGFIPIFKVKVPIFGSSIFVASIVLALMITPIITSVSRAVMAETPRSHCEAALALGGSRSGMVRRVILPFSRSGLVGGAMLGLGRAMGETIAVALILSIDFRAPTGLLSPGGSSIAGMIANQFGEASTNGRSALIGAGLSLFVLTLVVNLIARSIVNRSNRPKRPKRPGRMKAVTA